MPASAIASNALTQCRLQTCSNQATEEEPQSEPTDSDVDEDDDGE